MKECGDCNACCVFYEVKELNKAAKTPCQFLNSGCSGCSIYNKRPKICSDYICAWKGLDWPDEFRPDKSGLIIDVQKTETIQKYLDIREIRANAIEENGLLLKQLVEQDFVLCLRYIDDTAQLFVPFSRSKEELVLNRMTEMI